MKSVTELYQEMRALFAAETGMTLYEGSEMAVRLYAFAVQLHGLYVQDAWTAKQCFPQTATGEFLDRHATLRALARRAATRAQGRLRFAVETAQATSLRIPKGSACMSAGLVRFETLQEVILPAGALFVEVAAQASELGDSGNVPAGSVRVMALAPLGVSSCSNPEAFSGGAETEGDEALRVRVLESYRRMPNGTNAAYYEREALGFPGIVAVNVLARARGRGTVDVVIATATGAADASLQAAVQTHLQAQRELAVDLRVLAPVLVPLTLRLKLKVRAGADFQTVAERVQSTLSAHFDGRRLGESLLCAKVGQLVFSIPDVENVQILSPTQDVAILPGQLPRLTIPLPERLV